MNMKKVLSIYKSIFAPCDYADHYRTFRKQDVNPLNSCCYPLNHNICGGVPVDILLPFWTQEFSENYMNIFDDEKSSCHKDLPRIGVLDLRATGATYHAVLLFYVEVSTSSIGVKEFWVYDQDPWSREYLTYKRNGNDLYFRITGEYIPTETLCEQFVDEYNQWLKNIQFIKAHPETFK